MATNPYVNKVVYGNSTVMDISDTDTQESDVANGKVFYKGTGARSVGTANLDSAVWGNITGTLSNQTDLKNALDAKMSYADNGVLGAKNLLDKTKFVGYQPSEVQITQITDGIRAIVSTAKQYRYVYVTILNPAKNTRFIFSDTATITSGLTLLRADGSNDGLSFTKISESPSITSSASQSLTFDTGSYEYIQLRMYVTGDSGASIGDISFTNIMLRLASDSDDTYVPYAMTNKELTDSKANSSDLDGWTATSQVANEQVTFTGLDDTQGWGYDPRVWVDDNSTNLNPRCTINSMTGAGTANMSITYDTDADNGAYVRLRIIK